MSDSREKSPPPIKFRDLPRFDFTRAPAPTQGESARDDVAYGVQSLEDLHRAAERVLDRAKPKARK